MLVGYNRMAPPPTTAGVESAAEDDVVQRSGIDLAQGYWYGKPMTVDQIRASAWAMASINVGEQDRTV